MDFGFQNPNKIDKLNFSLNESDINIINFTNLNNKNRNVNNNENLKKVEKSIKTDFMIAGRKKSLELKSNPAVEKLMKDMVKYTGNSEIKDEDEKKFFNNKITENANKKSENISMNKKNKNNLNREKKDNINNNSLKYENQKRIDSFRNFHF